MLEATEAKHFRPTQAGPELVLGVAEGVQNSYAPSLLCGGPVVGCSARASTPGTCPGRRRWSQSYADACSRADGTVRQSSAPECYGGETMRFRDVRCAAALLLGAGLQVGSPTVEAAYFSDGIHVPPDPATPCDYYLPPGTAGACNQPGPGLKFDVSTGGGSGGSGYFLPCAGSTFGTCGGYVLFGGDDGQIITFDPTAGTYGLYASSIGKPVVQAVLEVKDEFIVTAAARGRTSVALTFHAVVEGPAFFQMHGVLGGLGIAEHYSSGVGWPATPVTLTWSREFDLAPGENRLPADYALVATAYDGGTVDGLHTSTIAFDLPPGATVTSLAGYTSPVPAPAAVYQLIAGMGLVSLAVRRRSSGES